MGFNLSLQAENVAEKEVNKLLCSKCFEFCSVKADMSVVNAMRGGSKLEFKVSDHDADFIKSTIYKDCWEREATK